MKSIVLVFVVIIGLGKDAHFILASLGIAGTAAFAFAELADILNNRLLLWKTPAIPVTKRKQLRNWNVKPNVFTSG